MKNESPTQIASQLADDADRVGRSTNRPDFERVLRKYQQRSRIRRLRHVALTAGLCVAVFCIASSFDLQESLRSFMTAKSTEFASSERDRPEAELRSREELIRDIIALVGEVPERQLPKAAFPAEGKVVEVTFEELSPNEQTAVQRLLINSSDQWDSI